MKLEERLNNVISEKDDEINKLEQRISELEFKNDFKKLEWQIGDIIINDDFYKNIPVPRIEMVINKLDIRDRRYDYSYTYGIVYLPYWVQPNKEELHFIPLSQTLMDGPIIYPNGNINMPWRDGVHIQADSILFNLPAYISCREENFLRKIEMNHFKSNEEVFEKMKF